MCGSFFLFYKKTQEIQKKLYFILDKYIYLYMYIYIHFIKITIFLAHSLFQTTPRIFVCVRLILFVKKKKFINFYNLMLSFNTLDFACLNSSSDKQPSICNLLNRSNSATKCEDVPIVFLLAFSITQVYAS